MDKRGLYFCGDIHGDLKTLVWQAVVRNSIKNSDIIILGDFGAGFDDSLVSTYNHIKDKLEKADVTIWTIRGNHDDPEYFKDETKYSLPRIKFMEDYKLYTFGDRTILPIGGACSLDILWRQEKNKEYEHWGSKRRVWWEDEGVERKKIKDLPRVVDIIISHTSPIVFDPVPSRVDDCPLEQYNKILDERNYLKEVLDNVKTDYWFYGHYHESMSGSFNDMLWKCLNIMEIYEAPEKIDHNIQGKI